MEVALPKSHPTAGVERTQLRVSDRNGQRDHSISILCRPGENDARTSRIGIVSHPYDHGIDMQLRTIWS